MTETFHPTDPQRFQNALARFDEENARDPNVEISDNKAVPRELVYSRWLTHWVLKLSPAASEELRLAARCQHLCRWLVPRQSYPLTRAGYLQWRESLKKFHAEKSGQILRETGYPETTVARVQSLNLKKNLSTDPETQTIEDALCLVFMERQFAALADENDEEKMIGILQKTWKKMSPAGREIALTLSYAEREKNLLQKALGPNSKSP